MESTRQKKVSRLIQKELALIFQNEIRLFSSKIILSVNLVRVSRDLKNAKIFLGFFPCKDPNEYLNIIKSKTNIIRNKLSNQLRNQLRVMPELQFYLDDSAEYFDNINKLLNK
tara:strand:- start:2678 stop:3016 length:339 start_codon:yes stop_codon:yes gene_type:complete